MGELKVQNLKVIELDQCSDAPRVQDALESLTGKRTVPSVFVQGKHIGGGSETAELYQSGQLREILQEAGVLEESSS